MCTPVFPVSTVIVSSNSCTAWFSLIVRYPHKQLCCGLPQAVLLLEDPFSVKERLWEPPLSLKERLVFRFFWELSCWCSGFPAMLWVLPLIALLGWHSWFFTKHICGWFVWHFLSKQLRSRLTLCLFFRIMVAFLGLDFSFIMLLSWPSQQSFRVLILIFAYSADFSLHCNRCFFTYSAGFGFCL